MSIASFISGLRRPRPAPPPEVFDDSYLPLAVQTRSEQAEHAAFWASHEAEAAPLVLPVEEAHATARYIGQELAAMTAGDAFLREVTLVEVRGALLRARVEAEQEACRGAR